MDVDRLRRWLPHGNSTLEAGAAALAGFPAGQFLRDEWPLLERMIGLFFDS